MSIVDMSREGENSTNARTVFISDIAIVRPMQEWGPARKDRKLNFELYVFGRSSQREGRNSSASGPQIASQVFIARI
jgi:hypothetical protein